MRMAVGQGLIFLCNFMQSSASKFVFLKTQKVSGNWSYDFQNFIVCSALLGKNGIIVFEDF